MTLTTKVDIFSSFALLVLQLLYDSIWLLLTVILISLCRVNSLVDNNKPEEAEETKQKKGRGRRKEDMDSDDDYDDDDFADLEDEDDEDFNSDSGPKRPQIKSEALPDVSQVKLKD